MLKWVTGLLSSGYSSAVNALHSLISTGLSAIAGVMDAVFGNVTRAWDQFYSAVTGRVKADIALADALYQQLRTIILHDIPVYAHTAWWWVTNPAALAQVLLWHLLRLMEDYAWTIAGYLGKFTLALVMRNVRQLARTVEEIIVAIL